MNSGSEVSAQLLLELNTAVAMTLPMGAEENSIMPMAPTPISDRAIQMPDPSSRKRLNSRMTRELLGSFFSLPTARGGLSLLPCRSISVVSIARFSVAQHCDEVVDEGDGQGQQP